VPFSLEKFARDVKKAMKKFGRCVVAVSEGIRDKSGDSIGAKFSGGEVDSHGNVQMSGTGALGDYLAKFLKSECNIKRVRADTFGYLQRSFPGIASKVDQDEAFSAGAAAVKAALKGELTKGTIAIVRENKKKYRVAFAPVPIQNAAKYTRSVPKEYIAKSGNDVTDAFLDYARPIVGELPHCEIL
jgi:6-phosphofructokinase 1